MKNCLVIYSKFSGRKRTYKKINLVKKTLSSLFLVEVFEAKSLDEMSEKIQKAILKVHSIIICGGDGTLNFCINEIMKYEKKPLVGYLNFGTLGDVGKNFGVSKNIKKSLQIILKQKTRKIDLGCIGNHYFVYMASNGTFVDVSSCKHRFLGKLSYYLFSIPKMLHKKQFSFEIKDKTGTKLINTPFILLLNGKYVGGFKINSNSSIDDGKMEMFYSKSSFLNGIPSFIFNTKKLVKTEATDLKIANNSSKLWCIDGEMLEINNPSVQIIKNCIDFYSIC